MLKATHPDSVSLVRPPKTTIPKTDAALPSNQYATGFEVVSGKNLLLAAAWLVLVFILWLRNANGEDFLYVFSGAALVLVLLNRTVLEMDDGNVLNAGIDCLTH